MDSVPYAFVDSVVELFDGRRTLNPLAQEVNHPLWKAAVDVHHRNREYYVVFVSMAENEKGVKLLSESLNGRSYDNLEPIRKNQRFARIKTITDIDDVDWEDAKIQGAEEAIEMLKTVAPQCESCSYLASVYSGCTASHKLLCNALSNSAFLASMELSYHGQASLDLLENQIRNSPFLKYVYLTSNDWPEAVLPLITAFCLKGRPGHPVTMTLDDAKIVDNSCIQNFFDVWQANGNLHFCLEAWSGKIDARELMEKGILNEQIQYGFNYFKHETEKSTAYFEATEIRFVEWSLSIQNLRMTKDWTLPKETAESFSGLRVLPSLHDPSIDSGLALDKEHMTQYYVNKLQCQQKGLEDKAKLRRPGDRRTWRADLPHPAGQDVDPGQTQTVGSLGGSRLCARPQQRSRHVRQHRQVQGLLEPVGHLAEARMSPPAQRDRLRVRLLSKFSYIEKIKTVGSTYIVACGLNHFELTLLESELYSSRDSTRDSNGTTDELTAYKERNMIYSHYGMVFPMVDLHVNVYGGRCQVNIYCGRCPSGGGGRGEPDEGQGGGSGSRGPNGGGGGRGSNEDEQPNGTNGGRGSLCWTDPNGGGGGRGSREGEEPNGTNGGRGSGVRADPNGG
uniref:ANF_receptor domain-containing protein n=1 Tax=Steinernema glaseri TaxID=37863 RepID=A0A1I8A474_9BILA